MLERFGERFVQQIPRPTRRRKEEGGRPGTVARTVAFIKCQPPKHFGFEKMQATETDKAGQGRHSRKPAETAFAGLARPGTVTDIGGNAGMVNWYMEGPLSRAQT
jgi:hypothetical protein